MPDIPIVDTHVHLWDPQRLRYSWLDGNATLNQIYAIEQYRAASAGAKVEQMVFMECGCDSPPHDEVDWATTLAASEPRLKAIVARAALEKGDGVRADLAALSANPLVKGVRRLLQGEKEAGFALRPDFVRGVQLLAEFKFSFDLCINKGQLKDAAELARRCPQVRFMLDHIAKPDIRGKVMDPWRAELKELAALPNVWCKVSGLVTEADPKAWTDTDLRPYLDHVVACFGPDRLAFGGDWPVMLLASTYQRWVETLRAALSGLPEADQRKIFHDNAVAFYRLPA